MLVTNHSTLKEFYAWWKTVPHMKLSDRDFALFHLTVARLKNETPEQAFSRLQRAFQPIHSHSKWMYSGRMTYDTLTRVLSNIEMSVMVHPENPHKKALESYYTQFYNVLNVVDERQEGFKQKYWYYLPFEVRQYIRDIISLVPVNKLLPQMETTAA